MGLYKTSLQGFWAYSGSFLGFFDCRHCIHFCFTVCNSTEIYRCDKAVERQTDKWWRDSPEQPPPLSVEFLQSLAGLVELSPAPCRCYRLEHSRNTKWGDWSLLDLWLLDPPQLNSQPPPPPSFPFCPPPHPIIITPSHPSFLSLFVSAASTSQGFHYWLICEWWSRHSLHPSCGSGPKCFFLS